MTDEMAFLMAIKRNISPNTLFGDRYTAFQITEIISNLHYKGFVEFNDEFELYVTSEGENELRKTVSYKDFFPQRKHLYFDPERSFKIYFPKQQNLLQTTSEHIRKNI